MTLLNNNLFSKENFSSLAKTIGQVQNNGQPKKVAYNSSSESHPRNTYSVQQEKYENKPKQSTQRVDNSRSDNFDNEVARASSAEKPIQTKDKKELEGKVDTKHSDSDNNLSKDTADSISSKSEKLKAIIDKVNSAVKSNSLANDKNLSSVLTDDDLLLLKELGLNSDEAILSFFSSQNNQLGKDNKSLFKSLLSVDNTQDSMMEKLSELSGLSQEQIEEMVENITISKGGKTLELFGSSQLPSKTMDESTSALELLALLSGKKDLKADKNLDGKAIVLNMGEESAEKNIQFENISHSFQGMDMPKENIEKIITSFNKDVGLSSTGSKSQSGAPMKSMASGKEASVFRSVKLDSIIGTTTRLVSQMNSGDSTSARMHLNPRSLGTVFVEIHLSGEVADIRFRTETAEAGKALESQIAQLKDQLQKDGITAGKIEYTQDGQEMQYGENRDNSREEMESRKEYIGYEADNSPLNRNNTFSESFTESMESIGDAESTAQFYGSKMTGRSL